MCKKTELISGGQNIFISKPSHFTLQVSHMYIYLFIHITIRVFPGDTIILKTWDGWTDFINLCILGYTPHVFAQLSDDELVSKFQMKVKLTHCCKPLVDLCNSLQNKTSTCMNMGGMCSYI